MKHCNNSSVQAWIEMTCWDELKLLVLIEDALWTEATRHGKSHGGHGAWAVPAKILRL